MIALILGLLYSGAVALFAKGDIPFTGPFGPGTSRCGLPVAVNDAVTVCGVVTRVDVAGHNYPGPSVTILTDSGETPEVPARNVYSTQGAGTSTVLSRDAKPINVGDQACIVGFAANIFGVGPCLMSLDADNNSQAVVTSDCYAAQTK
jgi:hypothetical protein